MPSIRHRVVPTAGEFVQCADTFESIAAEIMAAMILGGALSKE